MTLVSTLKNGVDVQKLTGLVEEVKREPWKGRLLFKMDSEWKGGFRARHKVSQYVVGNQPATHRTQHTVTSDEPVEILGNDAGISPSELVLGALASCLTVGYAANAAANGIDLKELRLELTAEGDLQGFLNLNGVAPRFSEISVKAYVKADATPQQIKELHDYVNAHSPVWDTIANPVRVKSELVT
ncbi:MAG: OsmC family protein [Vicinamibacterales bacterium]